MRCWSIGSLFSGNGGTPAAACVKQKLITAVSLPRPSAPGSTAT